MAAFTHTHCTRLFFRDGNANSCFMYLDIKAYIEIEYMPSIWLWLSFRFLVHLVSWTNGVVGTVECAFGWGGRVVGAGRGRS